MNNIDGFLIDLDGTVYRGNSLIDGAAEMIGRLLKSGKRVLFVSNRGNISRNMCQSKLADMGLNVPSETILLTSTVTGMYFKDRHPGCIVWVLGGQGLKDELDHWGVQLAVRPEEANWLVITLHETVTYHDLNQAFRAVRNGAGIIATNNDRILPTEEGDALDVAGMIGAIAYATGMEPEIVIGKPSSLMAETALQLLGLPPERCMVIGDSLSSDIALAKKHGMAAALVLSGSTVLKDAYKGEYKPDYVWDSLTGLDQILEGDRRWLTY